MLAGLWICPCRHQLVVNIRSFIHLALHLRRPTKRAIGRYHFTIPRLVKRHTNSVLRTV